MESLFIASQYGTKVAYTIASFVLVLFPLVFFHELGHFLTARFFGVHIEVFSIGFGPTLFSWKDRKGTLWKVGLLLFGGYVQMFGDAGAASTPDQKKLDQLSEEEKKKSMHSKTILQKILIAGAGPFANYLLALIIFAGIFIFKGREEFLPVVGELAPMEESIARKAGLKTGDCILSINNKKIDFFSDISKALEKKGSDQKALEREEPSNNVITIYFQRKAEKHLVKVREHEVSESNILGISPSLNKYTTIPMSFFPSISYAFVKLWDISKGSLISIKSIFTKQGVSNLSGPLQIAIVAKKIFSENGIWSFLSLMGILSVSLGFLNLFPIPVLDGGQIVMCLMDAVAGKSLDGKWKQWTYTISGVFLLALMAFIFFSDICKILGFSF